MSLQDILIFALILQTAQAACIPFKDCPPEEQTFTLVSEGSLRLRDVINFSYPETTVEVKYTNTDVFSNVMIIIIILQVNGNFSDYVCPLFEEYSQFSITYDNFLKENDSLSSNLSVLVLVAEKLLIDSCQYAMQVSNDVDKMSVFNNIFAIYRIQTISLLTAVVFTPSQNTVWVNLISTKQNWE